MNNKLENEVREAAELLDKNTFNKESIEKNFTEILTAIGEDPQRDGLIRTPDRVARAYQEILVGYRQDPVKLINNALFEVEYHDPVIVRDIEFYSLCEHHMLPIIGRAHVAYIPNGRVIGLSKIPRLVDMFSRRLQVQERMTFQIANFLNTLLKPEGVAVIVEGLHLCAMMRGVEKHNARMTTTSMLGKYKLDNEIKNDFLNHISRGAENLHI